MSRRAAAAAGTHRATVREAAEERFAWALIIPTLLTTLVLLALPLLFSLYLSFHVWDLTVVPSRVNWVGLQNYIDLLRSDQAWRPLRFTLLYTACSVGGEFVLGLALALLLHRAPIARNLFTSILVLPMMMTPIVTGLVWGLLFDPTHGMINQILHLGDLAWLGEPGYAAAAVMIATIWMNTPFVMILILAGLQSLSREPFEAAMIDGASAWRIFRHITVPLLMPTMLVALLIRTIFEFRAFDVIWILTQGGPAGRTETLSMTDYLVSFRFFAIGQGAALSWIMLVITACISAGYLYHLTRSLRTQNA
jgi:multiple sugar transport system permease protein